MAEWLVIFYTLLQYNTGVERIPKWVSTGSWPWRGNASCSSYRDSNARPFDHESGALPMRYRRSPVLCFGRLRSTLRLLSLASTRAASSGPSNVGLCQRLLSVFADCQLSLPKFMLERFDSETVNILLCHVCAFQSLPIVSFPLPKFTLERLDSETVNRLLCHDMCLSVFADSQLSVCKICPRTVWFRNSQQIIMLWYVPSSLCRFSTFRFQNLPSNGLIQKQSTDYMCLSVFADSQLSFSKIYPRTVWFRNSLQSLQILNFPLPKYIRQRFASETVYRLLCHDIRLTFGFAFLPLCSELNLSLLSDIFDGVCMALRWDTLNIWSRRSGALFSSIGFLSRKWNEQITFLVDEKLAVSLIIRSWCRHCLASCGVVQEGGRARGGVHLNIPT